ncbi:5-carboxymethyl-2-hydroxymuconate Delta-isomerase [Acinetobacter ursingii]|uniref:5-carboxymethyl-2-hydroxymuconate Delta-isomerase n=1 Tax=Acinetobacter ursingii TaxID=108980 RepID=UPI001D0EFC06|nr:5-carboxymethyl-2-hydroxymuconate Delta-isomerase [Acinetobacter ursingii]
MPHVIVDYSANLKDFEPRPLLLQINTALVETGYCEALDIKSRAHMDDVFVIGLGAEQQAYVHVKVYLLSGRDQQQKQEIGKNGEFKHEVRQFQKPYDNQQAEQISLMV